VSSGNALKLKEDCQAIKVTLFISVPRIYARIVEGVKSKFSNETGIKRCLIDSGVNSKMEKVKESGEYTHLFYDSVVFSKVREGFGG
jgi:long-chain acyl-CoA synthetase